MKKISLIIFLVTIISSGCFVIAKIPNNYQYAPSCETYNAKYYQSVGLDLFKTGRFNDPIFL